MNARALVVLVLGLIGCKTTPPGVAGQRTSASTSTDTTAPRLLAERDGVQVWSEDGQIRVTRAGHAEPNSLVLPGRSTAALEAELRPLAGAGLVEIRVEATTEHPGGTRERTQWRHAVRTGDGPLTLVCSWEGDYAATGDVPGLPARTVESVELDAEIPTLVLRVVDSHREYEGQLELRYERIELPAVGECVRSPVDEATAAAWFDPW